MASVDVIVNIGSYKGSYTETLIEHQLRKIKISSKGCERTNVNIIYIITIKGRKITESHKKLADYINKTANTLDVHVKTVFNIGDKGLAHGRNIGLLHSKADIVAYLDDDAVPSKNWINRLCMLFEKDKELAGVFGNIKPLFIDNSGTCNKVPREVYWLFSCTSSYMPNKPEIFYRGFGANMAFRREILYKLGGFKIGLGVGSSKKRWIGGEETELALRLCNKGYKVIYDPNLVVYHIVPQSRCALSYALKRAYEVGKTNGLITYVYRRCIRDVCKEQLTPKMLRRIVDIAFRTRLNNVLRDTNKILFKIVTSLSFILGMININKEFKIIQNKRLENKQCV